ncbi:hypothetical protein, partial [Chromobacterium haemolyticum]|uniref:hypothetical protein n=1 Tax=Chromobacterium haemolyticum TaxID=394935 RepID=UPI001EE64B77
LQSPSLNISLAFSPWRAIRRSRDWWAYYLFVCAIAGVPAGPSGPGASAERQKGAWPVRGLLRSRRQGDEGFILKFRADRKYIRQIKQERKSALGLDAGSGVQGRHVKPAP